MGFEHFGAGHLICLALCAGMGVLLCRAYIRAGREKRIKIRRGAGWAILACEALRLALLIFQGAMDRYQLPLHLCSLAVFFTFWHSRRPGELLGGFLYSTCMPGAVFALVFPDWTAFPIISCHSIVAFTVHGLIAVYPLMLVLSGDLRPTVRQLPACFAILLGLAAAVYAVDRSISANYMFLLSPAAGSPLEWFAALLGVPGYLLGYIPMLLLVWLILYLPFRKNRRDKP